ncbi:MAG: hypothetical protein ABJF11_03590 [Reichenbachiella sp.]|uniref:hypothetical protein n=1 Tax=Reichenbachiella sp. TaxID=2184521 RepID=UPI00326617A7
MHNTVYDIIAAYRQATLHILTVISHMHNLTAILLLAPTLAFSQGNFDNYSITDDSDTTFYFQFMEDVMTTFELTSIMDKQDDFVFRSWGPSSLLEITRTEDNIEGTVSYFVMESGKKKRVFVRSYQLPPLTSAKLYDYVITSEAYQLPSSNFIDNWANGFDGITFIYETKDKNAISFKYYWTPSAQEGILEAEIITQFNEELEELGDFDQYAKAFDEENPFSSYMYYGTSYSIIKLEERGKAKKKKTRDNKR